MTSSVTCRYNCLALSGKARYARPRRKRDATTCRLASRVGNTVCLMRERVRQNSRVETARREIPTRASRGILCLRRFVERASVLSFDFRDERTYFAMSAAYASRFEKPCFSEHTSAAHLKRPKVSRRASSSK